MKITGAYIDGFGIFHNQSIAGLDKNIILFYGQNEAGKSTLLSFIRSVLFGFPRANSKDPSYPPIAGGVQGGRIDLVTSSGDKWSVSRKPGVGGGTVAITGSDGTICDKAMLDQLLGGISYEAFRNIMAFGLTELQRIDTLSGEHIASAIYGAGLGTSMMAMPRARKKIHDQMARLFLKSGSKPVLNQLIGDLEQTRKALHDASLQSNQYDSACDAIARVEKTVLTCRNKLSLCRQELRRHEALERLRPDWINLQESIQELTALGNPTAAFPEEGLPAIDHLSETRERSQAALSELTARRERISIRIAALPVDENALSQAGAIGSLVENRNAYLEKIRKLPLLIQEIGNHNDTISRLMQRLGSRWDETTALTFDRSLFARETIRKHQTALDVLERELGAIETLLSDKQLKEAKETLFLLEEAVRRAPSGTKWPVAVVGGAGLAAACLTAYFGSYRDAALFLAGAVLAACAAWIYRKQQRQMHQYKQEHVRQQQLRVDKLQAACYQLETVTEQYANEKTAWENRCNQMGLSSTLSPVTALEVLDTIEQTVETIQARDRCTAEQSRIETEINNYRQMGKQTLRALGWPPVADDILPRTVTELVTRLEESKLNKREKETLGRELATIERECTVSEQTLRETESAVRNLLKSANTPDEATFRKIGRIELKRAALLTAAEAADGNIRRISGELDTTRLKTMLESLSLTQIKAGKEEADGSARELDLELSTLYTRRAELKQTLEALSTSDDISRLRAEEADLLADVEAGALEWARYALADHLIIQAREVFEKKHQPRILQDAGAIFSQMTGGRFQGVVAPLGENTLSVVNKNGERLSPDLLSRGTAEQLYLAVRFSYIRHQARKSDPLPVIMDDILVNFDPVRARKAAEAIVSLSASHQVLFFTCHPETTVVFQDIDPLIPIFRLDGGQILAPEKRSGPEKM